MKEMGKRDERNNKKKLEGEKQEERIGKELTRRGKGRGGKWREEGGDVMCRGGVSTSDVTTPSVVNTLSAKYFKIFSSPPPLFF